MIVLAYVLMAIGGLATLVGGIMLLVAAFRVSVGWGLTVLFLSWLIVPLLIFLVKYWREARAGFLITVGGCAVSAVGWFVLSGSTMTTDMAQFQGFEVERRPFDQAATTDPPSERFTWDTEGSETPAPTVRVETPTPTPEPSTNQDEADDEGEASPFSRTPRQRVIACADAADHVGSIVTLKLKDGSRSDVILDAVTESELRVTQRMGGGSVTYTVPRDAVEEIAVYR